MLSNWPSGRNITSIGGKPLRSYDKFRNYFTTPRVFNNSVTLQTSPNTLHRAFRMVGKSVGFVGKSLFYLVAGTTLISLASTAYVAYKHDFNFFDAISRNARTGWASIRVTALYKYFYYKHKDNEPDFAELESNIHLRAAQIALETCQANGGLYIKMGQYITANNHIYPKEWTETLRILQDQAPSRDFSVVEELFRQEFDGKHPDDMYASFEREPIAAASIAQVHRAVTKEGRKVAVKVQYPEIRDRFDVDMFTFDVMLHGIAKVFPKLDMRWAGPDLKVVLAQELNFEQEALNSERAYRNFQNTQLHNYIYVPVVDHTLSTKRILVTEWIDGIKITDKTGLKAMGFTAKDVMTKLCRGLANQIMESGFLHADPHPGNVFVRPHPLEPHKSQVVLLDHGLYKALSPATRLFYCRMYRGFVTGNYKEIENACSEIGIADWKLVAFFIFMRPVDMELFTDTGLTIDEARELVKDKKKFMLHMQKASRDHMTEVMDTIHKLPQELLLILRNNNILRSINRELAYPVNRFSIFGREAIYQLSKNTFLTDNSGNITHFNNQEVNQALSSSDSTKQDSQGLQLKTASGVVQSGQGYLNESSWTLFFDYLYYEYVLTKIDIQMWIEDIILRFLYNIGYIPIQITSDGIDIDAVFEELPKTIQNENTV